MSMLKFATIESRGTVACVVNHSEPYSPFSSPVWKMKITGRRGRVVARASRSATSSATAVPYTSSSAPL